MVDFKNLEIGQFAQTSGASALSDLQDFRTVWYGQIVNGKLSIIFRKKEKLNPKYDKLATFPFEGESINCNVSAKHTEQDPKPSGILFDSKYLSPYEIAVLAKSLGDGLATYVVDASELPAEAVVHSKAVIIALPVIINRDGTNFTVVIDSEVEVIKLGSVSITAVDGKTYYSEDEIDASETLTKTQITKAKADLKKATVK